MSQDNRNFFPAVIRLFTWLWRIALGLAIIDIAYHFASRHYYQEVEIRPWVPCYVDVSIPVPASLIEELNASTAIACSTTDRSTSQPCLCCFEHECYRGITWSRFLDTSPQKGRYVDEIDGVCYERSLPTWVTFHYVALNGSEFKKTEEGARVGYILRVIEVLMGKPIQGTVVECPKENEGGTSWLPSFLSG